MFSAAVDDDTLELCGGVTVRLKAYSTVSQSVIHGEPGTAAGDRTGGLVWGGGRAMAHFLAWYALASAPCTPPAAGRAPPEAVHTRYTAFGDHVLELGAGTGVASAALVALGCPAVTCTDGVASALSLARVNLDGNAPSDAHRAATADAGGGGGGGSVSPPVCRVGVLNWNHCDDAEPVEVAAAGSYTTVVAADVVYPSSPTSAMVGLFTAVRRLLRPRADAAATAAGPRWPWFRTVASTAEAVATVPPPTDTHCPPRFYCSYTSRKKGITTSFMQASLALGFGFTNVVWRDVVGPPGSLAAPEGAQLFVFEPLPHGRCADGVHVGGGGGGGGGDGGGDGGGGGSGGGGSGGSSCGDGDGDGDGDDGTLHPHHWLAAHGWCVDCCRTITATQRAAAAAVFPGLYGPLELGSDDEWEAPLVCSSGSDS